MAKVPKIWGTIPDSPIRLILSPFATGALGKRESIKLEGSLVNLSYKNSRDFQESATEEPLTEPSALLL